jgi:hypothetical protein
MITALFLQACATDGVDDPDRAAQGWRSTQTAMAGAGIRTMPGAGDLSGSGSVGPDGVSGTVMGTIACTEGGSMTVVAVGDVTHDAVSGALTVEFEGCKVDDVTIDGQIEYEGYVDDGRVSASIRGEVVWSGAVEGTCDIDVTAEVTTEGVTAGASLEGDVCGHAWADLV